MLRRGRLVVLSALVRTGVNNTSTDARGLVCGGVDKKAVCLDTKFEIRTASSFKLQIINNCISNLYIFIYESIEESKNQ